MRYMLVLLLLVLTLFPSGCTDPVTCGGPCFYINISGTATIRSVTPDIETRDACPNTVTIIYDFAPDDPSDVDDYRIPEWPDTGRVFTLPNGWNLPDDWAEKEGMTPGSEHICIRREITRGACTPVIFEFPDLNTGDWERFCD